MYVDRSPVGLAGKKVMNSLARAGSSLLVRSEASHCLANDGHSKAGVREMNTYCRWLVDLAANNKVPPLLKLNWELRCGYDPVAVAYESGRRLRVDMIGALVITAITALLTYVAWPLKENSTANWTLFAFLMTVTSILSICMVLVHAGDRKKIWAEALEFPSQILKFAELLGFKVHDMKWVATNPSVLQELTHKALVARAMDVRRCERALEALGQEERLTADKAEEFEARRKFRELRELLLKLSHPNGCVLVTKEVGVYFRDADKELDKEKPVVYAKPQI